MKQIESNEGEPFGVRGDYRLQLSEIGSAPLSARIISPSSSASPRDSRAASSATGR
jgi:hypothetical protein